MLSVVIPAYNEEKYIAYCLTSLLKQKNAPEFEVIVVNNASTDATVSIARKFASQFPLRVIEEKKKGRGMARATGFAAAKGEIILSTDADTQVPTNWVATISRQFENPKIDAITGIAYINDCGRVTNSLFSIIAYMFMIEWRIVFRHFPTCGFNFAVRKEMYEKCGGFNIHLNAGEDADLGIRVKKVGGKIVWAAPKVHCSGRRMQKGVFRAIREYLAVLVDYLLKKPEVHLSDVRIG